MDMDQAAVFLAGSILISLGFLVILGAVVAANNIVAKYWKSWGWTWLNALYPDRPPTRFAEPHELDKTSEPKLK